jgi:hypothetical protein
MSLVSEEESATIGHLAQLIMRKAGRARHDINRFFEFVIREEHTRDRLRTTPHQRIVFEFTNAHPKSVLMLPVGHGKTYSIAAQGLFDLGHDHSSRGMFVSYTQEQASRPLGMVKDYIESSQELRLVFPHLVPSQRPSDPWTQTHITVDRPYGIRDPSFVAVGMDSGEVPGARIKWINIDDILNRENTATKEQRDKIYNWVQNTVVARLDPRNSRCVVTNTPWHPDDLLHRLIRDGWPALRMEIGGTIEIYNTDWDPKNPEDLRPEAPGSHLCRLAAHDPDPRNEKMLFPQRISLEFNEELKRTMLPITYNQLYRCIARSDDTARCKIEYVNTCLAAASTKVTPAHRDYVNKYDGSNLVFTGVDLAISPGEESDDCAFFTFEVLPSGHRRILHIEAGKFSGPDTVKKIINVARMFKSIIRVENNAAQDYIRQFTLDADVSVPVKAHTTGRTKAHPEYGVEGLFIEMMNGAWLFPHKGGDNYGPGCYLVPTMERFVEACLNYLPSKHTDDVLMACYFAREQAREFGVLSGSDTGKRTQNIGGSLMAR